MTDTLTPIHPAASQADAQLTPLGPRIARLRHALRCPACRADAPLQSAAGGLACTACELCFPVQNGLPVLLTEAGSAMRERELGSATGSAMVGEYEAQRTPRKDRWSWLRPPGLILDPNPDMRAAHTLPIFEHAGPDTLVLNVGGGPRRYMPNDIALNIAPFINVDLVADAHEIPLRDGSVDSVICNAVLEHVYSPERVVAEMVRVLKPGGMLYAEVPFMFFFHGYPNDFRRYTREGMRRLFGALDPLEIGLSGGPMSALLQTSNIVLQGFVPERPAVLRKGFNGLFRWLLFPLKYLDLWLAKQPDAHLAACGFYVIGRKPADKP